MNIWHINELEKALNDMATQLSNLQVGETAIICSFQSVTQSSQQALSLDVKRRLMEMGAIIGSHVKMMHEAPISKDPIAIEVKGVLIAIRRNEAKYILVERDANAK